MIRRINYYLLTQYPLLWNTRLLWVAITNIGLHLLFLIAGVFSINAGSIADYYSVGRVGGGNQYTLSILCGLVVLIIWCMFYLRNNAFKSYYRIGKRYLAKEFAVICMIIFSSITYFMSYEWGVKIKVRSITNEAQMITEINVINRAAVYIPHEKVPYFILNTCAERNRRIPKDLKVNSTLNYETDFDKNYKDIHYETDELNVTDSTHLYGIRDSGRILQALRRPDAFSYLHYCRNMINTSYEPIDSAEGISQRNRQWLQQGRKDSVKAALQAMFVVLDKYSLDYRISADSILEDIFADSLFTMNTLIPINKFINLNGYEVENPFYINDSQIKNIFNFIEDCQPGGESYEGRMIIWNVVGYMALSLSILLLCYRRFSRKVFLISVVGTLVWAILFGLLAVTIHSGTSFSMMMLLFCGAVGGIGLWQLWQNKNKTMSGVLLNWHVYLAPYVVLLIVSVIIMNYSNYNTYRYDSNVMSYEAYMQLHYPISYWIKQHSQEIFMANLVLSFLYVAFLFNGWTKRWQVMPEE